MWEWLRKQGRDAVQDLTALELDVLNFIMLVLTNF